MARGGRAGAAATAAARASISRSCASVPRRNAYEAPPTAFTLAAANEPSGPRNTYSISCRSRLRSNGSDAIDVVTVAFSSPPRWIFARHGGSHSRTSHGTDARTPMNPITASYRDPTRSPPEGTLTATMCRSQWGRFRGSLVTSHTASGGASTSTEHSAVVMKEACFRSSSPSTTPRAAG
jgi:hypothetical protein